MSEEPDHVVMTFTEAIRTNLRAIREDLGMSRREVAELIVSRTGDTTWNQWVVYDIEGRKGRSRTVSPEELLTLAITYDRSLVELMTPPDEMDGRPVKVMVGQDQVTPELFFRLAFLLGPEYRKLMGEYAHHGRDQEGQIADSTATRHVADVYSEALAALLPEGVHFEEWIADEENMYALIEWVAENYGLETAWKLDSDRVRQAVIEEGNEE